MNFLPQCLYSLPSLVLLGMLSAATAGTIDTWRARDIASLDDGDSVGAWTSQSNRIASAPVGEQPLLKKNATPSGEAAVRFSQNRLNVPSNPVAGLTAFSLAVVFKVDQPGVDEGAGWSTKSGIVDANQAGAADDWGFSVRETGFVSFGTGAAGGSVGSSRVDLQACKLEYSIVSPK